MSNHPLKKYIFKISKLADSKNNQNPPTHLQNYQKKTNHSNLLIIILCVKSKHSVHITEKLCFNYLLWKADLEFAVGDMILIYISIGLSLDYINKFYRSA